MPQSTEERFRSLLSPLFPKHAQFRNVSSADGLLYSVNWKLGNDPSRPNKRSKRILIQISQETVEDYEDGNKNTRETFEKRIIDVANARLQQFNPDHNTPRDQPEREEHWCL